MSMGKSSLQESPPVLQKVEKKLEALQAKYKRTNRLTASDLLLVTGAASQACVHVVHSSWDCGQPEQPLLRLSATTEDAAQGPLNNFWDPCRGKGNRLSLLPCCKSHRLLLHATALRFATEQTSATCAAAAAAAAWNICCAPRDGCSVALGGAALVSPQQAVPAREFQCAQSNQDFQFASVHDQHSASDGCEGALCSSGTVPPVPNAPCAEVQARSMAPSGVCADLPAARQVDPSSSTIAYETVPVAASSVTAASTARTGCADTCSAMDTEPEAAWPLFETSVLQVYVEQERAKVNASLRAIGRALGATTAAARAESAHEVGNSILFAFSCFISLCRGSWHLLRATCPMHAVACFTYIVCQGTTVCPKQLEQSTYRSRNIQ